MAQPLVSRAELASALAGVQKGQTMCKKINAGSSAGYQHDKVNLRLVVSATCPEQQTTTEWLSAYAHEAGITVPRRRVSSEPSLETPPMAQTVNGGFRYIDHRTTKQGRLILEFEHTVSGEKCLMWFNIKLGKYRAGQHGQFSSAPRSKFRRFFGYVMGDQPKSFRWSRAHYKLGYMRPIKFSGTAVRRAAGYFEITKIIVHKKCTNSARRLREDCT